MVSRQEAAIVLSALCFGEEIAFLRVEVHD
jgi:hypothetical protein